MEIVSEGSLRSISRPASSASDAGRSIGSSRAAKTPTLQTFSSLELLPPETSSLSGIPGELFSALEQDVEIEDFEEDVYEDSEEESEYLESVDDAGCEVESIEDQLYSDEEQAIVKTSERTDDYDHGSDSSHDNIEKGDEPLELTEGEHADPQIREGLEKIKKLDKILSNKLKKEKEVKNHRHLMERMWKEQLQQIIKSPDEGSPNPLVGAALLALELGNEEYLGSSRDDPVTPVFPTQPLYTDEFHSARYQASSASGSGRECSSQADSSRESTRSKRHANGKRQHSSRRGSGKSTSSKKSGKEKGKDKEQDFIKRNKQLAADAGNVIPMTDEEKARLEKLLVDDDTDNFMTENPYDTSNLSITSGVGFQPDQESARALANIEEKLQALVPADELELLSSRALTYTPLTEKSEGAPSEHSRTSDILLDNLGNIDIGEKVLREEKDTREMHHRLMIIEKQLEKLKKFSEDETEDALSQELLRKLIGESSRTTSRSTTVGQTVVSSLSNPRHYAIEEGPGAEEFTPRPLSSISGITASEVSAEESLGGTPSTLRTLSTLSDVTLTADDLTPRTITSVSSFHS